MQITYFSHGPQHVLAGPEPGLLQFLHDGLHGGHGTQCRPPHPARQGPQNHRSLPLSGFRRQWGLGAHPSRGPLQRSARPPPGSLPQPPMLHLEATPPRQLHRLPLGRRRTSDKECQYHMVLNISNIGTAIRSTSIRSIYSKISIRDATFSTVLCSHLISYRAGTVQKTIFDTSVSPIWVH